MIYYVDNSFHELTKNPFQNNVEYTDNWILFKLVEDNSFYQFTGGGVDGVFQLVITKKNIDWQYRIMDFIGYENEWNKNIILAVNQIDLDEAKAVYVNHTYKDAFLREFERPILMHSTTKENYRKICECGYLKSWEILKTQGVISEDRPIGSELGDPMDYRNYIMFNNGGYSAEIVISSKQKGYIEMNLDAEYTAGARLYFDADKIAKDGLLVRDGAHLKVKDQLPLQKYLIWAAIPQKLGIPDITTPRKFSALADNAFQERFSVKL